MKRRWCGPTMQPRGCSGQRRALFICTFVPDEPLMEVLEAARRPPDVTVQITGDCAGGPRGLKQQRQQRQMGRLSGRREICLGARGPTSCSRSPCGPGPCSARRARRSTLCAPSCFRNGPTCANCSRAQSSLRMARGVAAGSRTRLAVRRAQRARARGAGRRGAAGGASNRSSARGAWAGLGPRERQPQVHCTNASKVTRTNGSRVAHARGAGALGAPE